MYREKIFCYCNFVKKSAVSVTRIYKVTNGKIKKFNINDNDAKISDISLLIYKYLLEILEDHHISVLKLPKV